MWGCACCLLGLRSPGQRWRFTRGKRRHSYNWLRLVQILVGVRVLLPGVEIAGAKMKIYPREEREDIVSYNW